MHMHAKHARERVTAQRKIVAIIFHVPLSRTDKSTHLHPPVYLPYIYMDTYTYVHTLCIEYVISHGTGVLIRRCNFCLCVHA